MIDTTTPHGSQIDHSEPVAQARQAKSLSEWLKEDLTTLRQAAIQVSKAQLIQILLYTYVRDTAGFITGKHTLSSELVTDMKEEINTFLQQEIEHEHSLQMG